MRTMHTLAQICRVVARAMTIFLLPTILFYVLFVGLQLASGEPGFIGLLLNMLLLLLLGAGFVIAWRREAPGALAALGALVVFIIAGLSLSGFRPTFGSSPLVWPISLIVAIIKPQSFDPVPSWIVLTSWAILAIPIMLFLASWLLRRKSS